MAQSKNDDTEDEGSKYEEFHVLAVDDNIIDRKVIEGLLRRSSCQVTSVNSVRKALEFLGLEDDEQGHLNADKVRVNMIITDYCMPELTGYDLLKRIKESSALKNIPVVIMSSENVECRRKRCLSEGAEEFLMKPVQLSDVMKLRSQMLKWKSCQQQPTSTKRKNMSDNNNSSSLSPQAERRPRLSGLTVA